MRRLILIISVILCSCVKNTPDDKVLEIISFSFLLSDNPILTEDIHGVVDSDNKTVTVTVKEHIMHTDLIPRMEVSQGALSNIDELTPISIGKDYIITLYNENTNYEYKIIFEIDTHKYPDVKGVKIKINGVECYYNKEESIYYAPLVRELWGQTVPIEISGDNITFGKIENTTIEAGKVVSVTLSMNKLYTITLNGQPNKNIVFMVTGLPIIAISNIIPMSNLSKNVKETCKISLIDPENGGSHNHYNIDGKIRVRGNSSSYYDKKSLALELYDTSTETTLDKSFLNMRSDDDWILDAMFMEQLRMRNRVSHDIWMDMYKLHYAAKEPKALATNRGEMVELFYNDVYMGIYCISEKVDRKQQNLDKTFGVLYKAEDWTEECIFKDCSSYETYGYEFFRGWQIQHPNDPNNWDPFIDLLRFVVESDYEKGASSTFGKDIANRVVIDNMVDFLLHLNIVNGTDNTGRNTFLSVYNTNSTSGEEAKFFYTPWDLDATFGTDWLYTAVNPNLFLGLTDVDVPSERTYGNFMLMKIAKYDIGNFGGKVKSRWKELRANQASDNTLIKRFEYYYDILNKSGAYNREGAKWGVSYQATFGSSYDPKRELEYIKMWIPKHLKYIDSYINNWDSNAASIVIN